jgi:hypothetical protein
VAEDIGVPGILDPSERVAVSGAAMATAVIISTNPGLASDQHKPAIFGK